MRANELRIGNIVDTAVGIIHVEEIPLKSNPLYNSNALHPIPLTKEWLKKVDWKGYVYLSINTNFSLDDVGHLYYHGDYTGINIQYVHQLQNLYFALTNTELELK